MKRSYPDAVAALLDEFAWNSWFLDHHWPENEPRVKAMVDLSFSLAPAASAPGTPLRVLELGCANGYLAYLFSLMGAETAAMDAYDDPKREEMFRKGGIAYTESNLNDARPLSEYADRSFDVVLMGEVFEHILNHPAGVLQAIYRILRPGGLVVLTTPNPSRLAIAYKVLKDQYVLWGTQAFMRDLKIDGGKLIDRGDIHYHEYPAWLVKDLVQELGYQVVHFSYYTSGPGMYQSLPKRLVKHLLRLSGLATKRLLALGYIIVARKPA